MQVFQLIMDPLLGFPSNLALFYHHEACVAILSLPQSSRITHVYPIIPSCLAPVLPNFLHCLRLSSLFLLIVALGVYFCCEVFSQFENDEALNMW